MFEIEDAVVTLRDGRRVGVAISGPPAGCPVVWFHGGPGSRREPDWLRADAAQRGLRVIALDRPGYGASPPEPGRTIMSVVADTLAVADHFGIDQFVAVGVSTGGAYALAMAALHPERTLGVVACCAVTDARHLPARATLSHPHVTSIWEAPDRVSAIAAATASHGVGGSKLVDGGMDSVMADSDRELFGDQRWMQFAMTGFSEMFRSGLEGLADDRIADRDGWTGFDVCSIRCPVTVLHGDADLMVDSLHAEHTAELVPDARLVVVPGAGHFSVEAHIIDETLDVIARAERR